MGGKTAPKKRRKMGQGEILQDPRHPELGIYRHRKTRGWNEAGAHPAARVGHANTAACEDQSRRESARSTMGTVLRVPVGQENSGLVKRPCEAVPRLAQAGRPVF